MIWLLARASTVQWEMMTGNRDHARLCRLTQGDRNSAGGRLDCGVSGMQEPGARRKARGVGCAATWWPRPHGPCGASRAAGVGSRPSRGPEGQAVQSLHLFAAG